MKKAHPIVALLVILAAILVLHELGVFAALWWILQGVLYLAFLAAIILVAFWAWKAWTKN